MKIRHLLNEAAGVTAAFAFGRFNPAHQGHVEVWKTVQNAGVKWYIGTNPSTLGPNDPLTFEQKSAWMEEIYPAIAGHIAAEQSVVTLAAKIYKDLGNKEDATIAYITDDTDWAWSGKLLNQYNGVEGRHGYYKFAQIVHVPSPRVSSATALRDAARANDKVAFYHASGTDPKLKVNGLTYFDTVKQACEKYPLPVKRGQKNENINEASLATMRSYFAGNKEARDEMEITKQRKHYENEKRKEFSSPQEYEQWLKKRQQTPIGGAKTEDVQPGVQNVSTNKNLIPFPQGTTLVKVSDTYDWYKLGQVISDLDDADPNWFGQGAPETILAFGSEEEEHKILPLLQKLGLKLKDVDQPVSEAYRATDLFEYLRKIHKRWAIVSKKEGRPLVYFKGEGKPSKEWVKKQERRIEYFKHKKK